MALINKLKIEFYKIAKKLDISMTRSTPKLIEFYEEDEEKVSEFRSAIRHISKDTITRELIRSREYEDINRFDIRNSKALYLIDDDYYNELIGLGKTEQLIMF